MGALCVITHPLFRRVMGASGSARLLILMSGVKGADQARSFCGGGVDWSFGFFTASRSELFERAGGT